jgi:hypothetical protein
VHPGLEARAVAPPERERLECGYPAARIALGRQEERNRFSWRTAIPRARDPELPGRMIGLLRDDSRAR